MSKKRKYPAAELDNGAKDAFVVAYLAVNPLGVGQLEYLDALQKQGRTISLPTFKRWKKRFKEKGQSTPQLKRTGRKRKLKDEEIDILVGWVLSQNATHKEVHLDDVCDFVRRSFEVSIVVETARQLLHLGGFRCYVTQNSSSGYKLSETELKSLIVEWINAARRDGLFPGDPSKLASIDFTFTGHRTDRRTTYSAKGGGNQKIRRLTQDTQTAL